MSLPTEIDFILVKMGDGATPTEAFATLCGLQDATVNRVVQSTDRFVRDCAKPGEVPFRKKRANGKQIDVTGTGLTNADNIEDIEDALGQIKNFKLECYENDGTDAGNLLGTFAGAFMMTAANLNVPRDGDGASEVTLESHGAWTYTAAA